MISCYSIIFKQYLDDLDKIILEERFPRIQEGSVKYYVKSYITYQSFIYGNKACSLVIYRAVAVIMLQLPQKLTFVLISLAVYIGFFLASQIFFIPSNRMLIFLFFMLILLKSEDQKNLIWQQTSNIQQNEDNQKNRQYQQQKRVIDFFINKNYNQNIQTKYKQLKKVSAQKQTFKSQKDKMIKDVLINRFSDGTVFCEASDDLSNNELQNVRMKVKNFHRQATPYTKPDISNMRQIENKSFSIFYKINSYVVFTVIVENGYPLKLVNVFLDTIVSAFFDEAKTILGSHDLQSRLQSIQGSHYFVKFDRIIKQKKRQFDDPKSVKNIERMKRQLQSIQEIMKENMSMLDNRHKELLETEEKARKVNEESKQFERKTNKLKWNIWFKKNLIWIILVVTIIILGWVLL